VQPSMQSTTRAPHPRVLSVSIKRSRLRATRRSAVVHPGRDDTPDGTRLHAALPLDLPR